jgi:hypothetical protein
MLIAGCEDVLICRQDGCQIVRLRSLVLDIAANGRSLNQPQAQIAYGRRIPATSNSADLIIGEFCDDWAPLGFSLRDSTSKLPFLLVTGPFRCTVNCTCARLL